MPSVAERLGWIIEAFQSSDAGMKIDQSRSLLPQPVGNTFQPHRKQD
ncbi:MAG: hypothetical protein AB1Z50_03560 [Desulfuromonadales bacterium]